MMKAKCVKCRKKSYCSGMCREHFRDYIEKKVKRTITRFKLFSKKALVGVAVSGGKDSTALLYVLKKLGYRVEGITIDPGIKGYSDANLENLKRFCKKYNIVLHQYSFKDEFGKSLRQINRLSAQKGMSYSPCFLCGVLRRNIINKKAKELGFSCLATGHNLDDEAQSFVMNVFRNDKTLAMRQGPVSGLSRSKAFVKRVKPLYLCAEKETAAYSRMLRLPVKYGSCPMRRDAYRKEYADMLDDFEKRHPSVKYNIVRFFLRTLHAQKQERIKQGQKSPAKAEPSARVSICPECGEPCSGKLCKSCEIMKKLTAN